MNFTIKPIYLIITLGGLMLLYLYSLWGRMPDIDDAWIGEHAYWQALLGHARSNLMTGITMQEDFLLVHHKLLTLQGAAFIKMFGFSLYTLKSISLLYFAIFITVFYLYTVRFKKIFDNSDFLIASILLISFPWVFKYSFHFRPEIMVMTYTFISFILLEKVVKNSHAGLYAVIAGLLSGLAAATHLNGIIAMGAGLLFLVVRGGKLPAVVFAAGALAGFSVYFYDFSPEHGFSYWWYQFSESPALDQPAHVHILLQPFMNLLNEHMRFFHDPKIAIFSIFTVVTLVGGSKYLYKKHPDLVWYTLLLVLLTAMISVFKTRKYILIYFPFLVIMLTLTIRGFIDNKDMMWHWLRDAVYRNYRRAILLLAVIYLAAGIFYNGRMALQKFSRNDYRELTSRYLPGDQSEKRIIAPMTFIFNEIPYYKSIQGQDSYTEMQETDAGITGEGFLQKASTFDTDHIILTPYFIKKLGLEGLTTGKSFGSYRVVDKNDNYLILTRIKDR
jgi:hypothetical protein